jgi:ABC-type multidrug transport system permease subunit
VPLLIIAPLTFLGGSFYSIDMLPPAWQKVALLNPVVYLSADSAEASTGKPTWRSA